jgi:hypothetical protein
MTAAWEAKLRTEAREAVETITQLRVSVDKRAFIICARNSS